VLFISASACSVFSVSLLTCLLSVLCGFFFCQFGPVCGSWCAFLLAAELCARAGWGDLGVSVEETSHPKACTSQVFCSIASFCFSFWLVGVALSVSFLRACPGVEECVLGCNHFLS
jgi:hypothetical protein